MAPFAQEPSELAEDLRTCHGLSAPSGPSSCTTLDCSDGETSERELRERFLKRNLRELEAAVAKLRVECKEAHQVKRLVSRVLAVLSDTNLLQTLISGDSYVHDVLRQYADTPSSELEKLSSGMDGWGELLVMYGIKGFENVNFREESRIFDVLTNSEKSEDPPFINESRARYQQTGHFDDT